MVLNPLRYNPAGDKKNSDFFNEYKTKIYKWRKESGLTSLLENLRAIVVQVESGDAYKYLKELYIMSPYRYSVSYRNASHNIYILRNMHCHTMPHFIILEPLSFYYEDEITQFNKLYPIGMRKSNARYIGEIFQTRNMLKTKEILETHNIRFHDRGKGKNMFFDNKHFVFTTPSPYTFNRFGYTHSDLNDFKHLKIGERIYLPDEVDRMLKGTDEWFHEKGLHKLIIGIDHMATRILSSDRESAILEFLTCSNYYFWGAYNIVDQNSSTNVNRNPKVSIDRSSPAKVFTANNTPYFANAFTGSPMPTESFVRNLGPRMHHIAQEVKDGDYSDTMKNIDYVVSTIKETGIEFLAKVVGGNGDLPDLKQIFSKRSKYSMLITEYVQRLHNFTGFFTRSNVAALTEAAGQDEIIAHGKIFD